MCKKNQTTKCRKISINYNVPQQTKIKKNKQFNHVNIMVTSLFYLGLCEVSKILVTNSLYDAFYMHYQQNNFSAVIVILLSYLIFICKSTQQVMITTSNINSAYHCQVCSEMLSLTYCQDTELVNGTRIFLLSAEQPIFPRLSLHSPNFA